MAFVPQRGVVKKYFPCAVFLMVWGSGLHASVATAADEQEACCKKKDRDESQRITAGAFRTYYFSSTQHAVIVGSMMRLHHATFKELPFAPLPGQELRRLQIRAEEAEKNTAMAQGQMRVLEAQLSALKERLVEHKNFAIKIETVLPTAIAFLSAAAAAKFKLDNTSVSQHVTTLLAQQEARDANIGNLQQQVQERNASIGEHRRRADEFIANITLLRQQAQEHTAAAARLQQMLDDIRKRRLNADQ